MKTCEELRKVQEPSYQDHVDMLRQPDCWPNGYFLPLKKKGWQDTELYDGKLGVIYKGHMMAHLNGMRPVIVKYGVLGLIPKHLKQYERLPGDEYESIDNMLIDGWMVD